MQRQARKAMRSEDQEDEGVRQLILLLKEDPEKTFTEEHLKEGPTLERALEIAYCMRAGTPLDKVPSIHIKVYQKGLFQPLPD